MVFVFYCLICFTFIMPSSSIHVANSRIFSFFMDEYSIMYVHHNFFLQPSNDGRLGFFHISAIVNNDSMTMGLQLFFFQVSVFVTFGYIPRRGIDGSYGSFLFHVLNIFYIVFHSGKAFLIVSSISVPKVLPYPFSS